MSGIVLRFSRDCRPVTEGEIDAMLAAAPYRGPDGQWMRLDGEIGFGSAKLAVTPEEEDEQQPLLSPRSGCMLMADLRLDNRADLFALLPGQPRTASDAALLLALYEQRGLDAFPLLVGDFAVAIWDPRDRRVVCARDTSGQRSLYYRLDSTTLVAASEIHQLLQDRSVSVAPNMERVRDSLVPMNAFHNAQDTSETFYQGIFALPAGHVLVVDRSRQQLRRYWEFSVPPEIRYRSDEKYAEHFRALFFDVMRARLRTSRPLGVLLSGGLDSSSIACSAQQVFRLGGTPSPGFATFTSVFDSLACDERVYVEEMQHLYNFDARYIPVGQLAGRLDLASQGFRESPDMGITEMRDGLLREADGLGIRTLLTGDVADSCLYGSRIVFDSLLRQGHLGMFYRTLKAYRRTSTESLAKILAFYCMAPLLPLSVQKSLTIAYVRRRLSADLPYLLPRWMPDTMRNDLAQRHITGVLAVERGRRFANETREAEFRLLYPPECNRYPSPWSIQVVRPFADRRLHEFLLAIPPEQKFTPHPETDTYYAGSKQILRRAMRGVLPESVRTRTDKTVFSSVLQQEVERQWPVYEDAFGPGSSSRVAQHGYVDAELFWERLCAMRRSTEGADLTYVMRLVELETWLRSLEQPRPNCVTVAPVRGSHEVSTTMQL